MLIKFNSIKQKIVKKNNFNSHVSNILWANYYFCWILFIYYILSSSFIRLFYLIAFIIRLIFNGSFFYLNFQNKIITLIEWKKEALDESNNKFVVSRLSNFVRILEWVLEKHYEFKRFEFNFINMFLFRRFMVIFYGLLDLAWF